MKVSYAWLQEHFNETLPPVTELAELITLKAYEVESIEEVEGDYVFDIDVLPNRASDSLSHQGIAREIGTLTGLALKETRKILKEEGEGQVDEYIELSPETKQVARAMKRVAIDVRVEESPEWLVSRLASVGQRSINTIVDLTNFVMLETGQPVHAFDWDKIGSQTQEQKTKKIIIREAKEGEKIVALDDKEYTLEEGMLVIADENRALDIAGIKGGKESAIDEGTTRILLSVCNFDPVTIRITSQKLGLRTDASKRFENGITPLLAEEAMDMLAGLMEEHGWGRIVPGAVDYYPHKQEARTISLSLGKINKLLGSTLRLDEVEALLDRLFFKYTLTRETFLVTAPAYRLDISEEVDVVEEIGRVYGYGNIEKPDIAAHISEEKSAAEFILTHTVRDLLVREGYSEVYTYSFQERGEVELRNRLAEDKGFLRSDLKTGIRAALAENSKRKDLFGTDVLKVFEIGHVFKKEKEEVHLAVGLAAASKKFDTESELSKIERLLEDALNVELTVKISDAVLEADLTGVIERGEFSGNEEELEEIRCSTQFETPSPYPYVLRDIAVWAPQKIENSRNKIEEIIEREGGELLLRHFLFDEFSKDGRTSYAFHLVFQSKQKTLSDEEVNEAMSRITDALSSGGFEVR